MTTDEEAEAFLAEDVSDLDYTGFRPMGWEAEPKTARLTMRLAPSLMQALKTRAADQRLIREALERAVRG